MKILFLLSLLLTLCLPLQSQTETTGAPLSVTNFKWKRARRTPPPQEVESNTPMRAVIPQNKIFARNARANESPGARDPNSDTLDGRSEALEKSVAESRSQQPEPVDGYAYHIKVHNTISKTVEAVFWEYRFEDPANADSLSRRQFLCGVEIGSGKSKDLEAFSRFGPSDVVNVKTLDSATPFKESIVINRIEYTDGTVWQRRAWNLAEVKASYERVLREPWLPGMCKAL